MCAQPRPETWRFDPYRWIEPGARLGQVRGAMVSRVRRFWEKPAAAKAEALYRQGCLWNVLVLVGRAEALVALFATFTPALLQAFDPIRRALGSAREGAVVRDVYAALPASNFSQAILARCPERLGVLRVDGVYWSGWGDAARIQADRTRFGFDAPLARGERVALARGLSATPVIPLGLLLVAEITLAVGLRGAPVTGALIDRDPVSGTAYYAMLGVFAMMPWLLTGRDAAPMRQ